MSSRNVSIVDYDCGNLASLTRALTHVGATRVTLAQTEDAILSADLLILPGVGAFPQAMGELERRGMSEAISNFAHKGRPLLGICLGMQLLFESSCEFTNTVSLGLIPGHVERINPDMNAFPGAKLPHIGWSRALPNFASRGKRYNLLADTSYGEFFYFNHSFAAQSDNPDFCVGISEYCGYEFCSILAKDNIFGCQFHPEKSGAAGLNILSQFVHKT